MSRKRLKSIVALTLAITMLVLAGCSAGNDSAEDLTLTESRSTNAEPMVEYDGVMAEETMDEDLGTAISSDVATEAEERLIIRNKTMRIEVEAVEDAISTIERLASDHGGIITAMQVATNDDSPVYRYDEYSYSDSGALMGYVTVRVPAADYEAFLSGINGIGTVLYQAENADDVTQQHVDMSARLENLRAEEIRLREFFDAAKDVDDMLAIEQQLSRVRGEIESLDAQVKYLERQAAMATVTIELTEPQPLVRPSGDDWGFGDAVTNGFRGAAGVIQVVIALIIGTSPLWIVALVAFFVIRAILRRRTAKHRLAAPAAEDSAH